MPTEDDIVHELQLALDRMEVGDYLQARDVLLGVLETGFRTPHKSMALTELAWVESNLGNHEKALIYAKESIALTPRDERSSVALLLCLMDLEMYKEGIDEIARFLSLGVPLRLYKQLREPLVEDYSKELEEVGLLDYFNKTLAQIDAES